MKSDNLDASAQPEAVEGFSLIDMLVALVLLSVVTGLMAAFIGQLRTITRLQTEVSAQADMDALVSYLEGAIGGALPMTFIDSQPDKRILFEGGASELRFVSIARQGVKAFGLRETTIALEDDGSSMTLMQRFAPRRLDPSEREAASASTSLAENISAFQLQYLSYASGTMAPVWVDAWKDRTGLPAAVRFTLEAEREGRTVYGSGYAIVKLSDETERVASGR